MFNSRGFTLIEVLISMVILAIGLLGLAAMQAMSLRDNQDAYYYQQATLLAYEMQDRIRANNGVTDAINTPINWTAVVAAKGNSCNSLANACLAPALAAYDLWYWEDSVKKIFPAPKGANAKVVEIKLSSNVMKNGCQGTYPASLCLIIHWGRVNVKKTGVLSGDASVYLEVTP